MRWCIPVAVLLGLSVQDAVSFAQGQGGAERLAAQRPTSGLDEHPDAGYFAATGVVRFQMIQGRLQLDSPRHRKGSQTRDEHGVFENITVTAQRGIPSLHYVYQTKNHHLTLSVKNATHVQIDSWFPKTGERARLDQPASGPIRWQVENGEHRSEFTAPTLLHVRLQDAVDFDRHVARLVRLVLRGRSLRAICNQTRVAVQKMLNEADLDLSDSVTVLDVHECVDRLQSGKRAVRRDAELQLLRWGTPIVPIVNAISAADLDAEQSSRLNIVLKRLKRNQDDTAASLATMLMNDQSFWQCIGPKLNQQETTQANRYLGRIGLAALRLEAIAKDERPQTSKR